MSIFKRFSALVLSLVMVLSCGSMAFAAEKENDAVTVVDASLKFKEMLSFVYSETESSTRLYGFDGEDITEEFRNETIDLFSSNDWDTLHKFYSENVDLMKRETVVQEKNGRKLSQGINPLANDISQTTYSEYMDTIYPLESKTPGEGGRDLYFKTRGVIYFDPNTAKISSTSGPYLQSISIGPGDNDYNIVKSNASIAKNKLSATFSITLHIWFSDWLYYDYGNITDTFKAVPEI